jgi:hypothetical protein
MKNIETIHYVVQERMKGSENWHVSSHPSKEEAIKHRDDILNQTNDFEARAIMITTKVKQEIL